MHMNAALHNRGEVAAQRRSSGAPPMTNTTSRASGAMPPSTGSPAGTYRRARSEQFTTLATTSDDHQVAVVHAALARKGLLSREHLVDGEYTDSNMLVTSPQHLNKRTKKNAVWTLARQHAARHSSYRSPLDRSATHLPTQQECAFVSRRCIKATPLRGAAQPVTRWACGMCSLVDW